MDKVKLTRMLDKWRKSFSDYQVLKGMHARGLISDLEITCASIELDRFRSEIEKIRKAA